MNTILIIILAILLFSFVFERVLDSLNLKHLKPELPGLLKGVYDSDKYARSQVYEKEKKKFGLLVSSFSFIVIFLFFLLRGFGWIDGIVTGITGSAILQALLFFGVIFYFFDLITIPFEWYSTFVIEEKYNFNKTTVRTFILDKLKSWMLMAVIGGGILALLVWFYGISGKWFWLIAWAAVTLFSVFMSIFYSELIVPLFNKQIPLREGELRDAIEDFAAKKGFSLKGLYEIDGSKRSTKGNAYFTGLGRKKRIVLYDTLIDDLTVKEVLAVLAHEIGHYKKKHIIISLISGIIQTGLLLFVLSFFLDNESFAHALGAEKPAFHLSVLVFGIIFSPISLIIGIIMNMVSRKNEYQADDYARENGLGEDLASGLIKMSEKHLSNLTPHPAYVFVHYSHPPLLERLKNLNKS